MFVVMRQKQHPHLHVQSPGGHRGVGAEAQPVFGADGCRCGGCGGVWGARGQEVPWGAGLWGTCRRTQAGETGVCTECEPRGEPVRLWGVGNREKAGEGGVVGLRKVMEALEADCCWRVQSQGSWQLWDTHGCCGGQGCGLGLGVGEGWSARGGV